MNSEVKTILDTISVEGEQVPNALMYFDGETSPSVYILYSPSSEGVGLAGDDKPIGLIERWDIDVYSKTNYVALAKQVIKAFIDAGWVYRGAGNDTYDEGTKVYHRLLEFEKEGDTAFLEEGA